MSIHTLPIYEIDGERFDDLQGFFREFHHQVVGANPDEVPDHEYWGLDSFNDYLRPGWSWFGAEGLVLRWVSSAVSRSRLGYDQTVVELEARLKSCHPTNRPIVRAELAAATARSGPTVFDWLVEIIEIHGPGGSEADNGVVLELL